MLAYKHLNASIKLSYQLRSLVTNVRLLSPPHRNQNAFLPKIPSSIIEVECHRANQLDEHIYR